MQPVVRAFSAALTSAALALSGNAVAIAAPQQPIEWLRCQDGAPPGLECGTLTLPIDWANPSGERFDLAVARRRATDQEQRVGVLVVNPGGPGSGVEFTRYAQEYFSPEILRKFDIIGFDPRGVGGSQQITCSLELLDKRPSEYPRDAAEFDELVAYNKKLREDCRARSGPIFDHATSADVAEDVDAIRRALGELKINYFGVSSGTTVGHQYAERHGRFLRAMVIDSNMDRSVDIKRYLETGSAGAEDTFQEWVRWNERTPSAPFRGKDLRKIWTDLLARADRGELTEWDDREVTPATLTAQVVHAGQGPWWPQFSSWVRHLHDRAPALHLPEDVSEDVAENAYEVRFCNDFNLRISSYAEYQRLYEMEKVVAPNTRGSVVGHAAAMGCAGLPQTTSPPRPLNIRNAPKILMTNARHDPRAPYEWALNVHAQSRNTTVLVTYDGAGHGVYSRSECTRSINDRYLVDLKLPRNGTRCAAVDPG